MFKAFLQRWKNFADTPFHTMVGFTTNLITMKFEEKLHHS
jgi:hypothetical protein